MNSQKPGSLLLWVKGDIGTHWGNIRVILRLYLGYIGIMGNNMATTI